MLKYFITSKTKRKILKLFLINPEKKFHIRGIEKILNEPFNAIRRELNYLQKGGLLISWKEANLKYFQINKNFPLLSEFRKIINLSEGIGDLIKERVNKLGKIDLAFIYGSVARGEENIKSDIDLFILGNINEIELHYSISEIEKEIGREINYVMMTKNEFNKRLKSNEPFIKRILKEEKIVLKGAVNDIARTT